MTSAPCTRTDHVEWANWRDDGRVIALDCINAVRDYVQGRKLIVANASADKALLADVNIQLKDLAPA